MAFFVCQNELVTPFSPSLSAGEKEVIGSISLQWKRKLLSSLILCSFFQVWLRLSIGKAILERVPKWDTKNVLNK